MFSESYDQLLSGGGGGVLYKTFLERSHAPGGGIKKMVEGGGRGPKNMVKKLPQNYFLTMVQSNSDRRFVGVKFIQRNMSLNFIPL